MRSLLFGSFLIAALASPAIAGSEFWRSESGKTSFESAASAVCAGQRVVNYTTQYGSTTLQGYLWVNNVSGCRFNDRTTISGYFEEVNRDRNQWCKGNLTLSLVRRTNGSWASWRNVQPAAPNARCAGTGEPIDLNLIHEGV